MLQSCIIGTKGGNSTIHQRTSPVRWRTTTAKGELPTWSPSGILSYMTNTVTDDNLDLSIHFQIEFMLQGIDAISPREENEYRTQPPLRQKTPITLLTDIFPTAWYALDCAGFQSGDTVAIFGAGPVGLLCAYAALFRGASRVYSIDYILAREPRGVRRSCDCVGLEAEESVVLNNCVRVTEPTGGIGFIGEYVPAPKGPAPGVPLANAAEGVFPVLVGELWVKALSLKGGGAEIHSLQPFLRDLVESGKVKPSFVVDEVLDGLEDVPEAYRRFEKREFVKAVVQLGKGKGV
ncbi:hypothetical protein BO70DRAFT_401379 [Aspergillus heteromorphus CBS 117.55]|uniref:NAD(P)-binding protein n=1 Tax=Aspergillus heteromorphus CBS 117.55 TaxID=1448321 RepID=A0A317USZ1_9EURO|nr:uncharacterized protein BO70DRAFT_401379 [Aspergillus heteromorphus CBS 117.55]PWY64248.1 hypothetical protein BO70DRAFT_401379 [Aspergillus heteromorphus CBS 117.55]